MPNKLLMRKQMMISGHLVVMEILGGSNRWKKVLRLIIAGNGDNTLVDSARGDTLVPIVLNKEMQESGDEE